MNTRNTILAAIGGAVLVAIPTTVAVAVTESSGFHAPVAWHSDDSPHHGIPDRGMRFDDDARLGNQRGGRMGMDGPMGMGGRGNGNQSGFGEGGGVGMHRGMVDPRALVSPGATLSADDADALDYMINEEKVAHDLYLTFADAWGMRVFQNVAVAEQHHAAALRSLLDAYGAEDPTRGLAVGEFSEPALQELYDTLVADGLTSSTRALTVGALVEETDISDLRDRATSADALDSVFSYLESASENHLRAFVTTLSRAGVDYEAQLLSDSEVSAITGR